MPTDSYFSDEASPQDPQERKSLDLVQRAVLSALLGVVLGLFSATLAVYLVLRGHHDLPHSDVIGLWVMTGVIGLVTSGSILMINRRKLYHPLLLLGLIPMAAAWYGIFH
ncbi:hypothetical protein MLP_38730 [Microlunatus phosphovorus NM-1]|uniref:Uncharacterized protein n=1 Tax=Microlunatus phosphovorus (strain ATCC 700054 / DSM 10555 / JCM 9379 / NBRC 101784 / NCIMB 13414 / VKM Ac-1990 / NM-1) TaxID=1032480 RepID=F5XQ56_MICPN|nr:hypothetical protein [Microlunatus phosphovorus]BAK36887.1 hypothetical protein MLP_38730 [Microlunatus phosphovorus NM-1]